MIGKFDFVIFISTKQKKRRLRLFFVCRSRYEANHAAEIRRGGTFARYGEKGRRKSGAKRGSDANRFHPKTNFCLPNISFLFFRLFWRFEAKWR